MVRFGGLTQGKVPGRGSLLAVSGGVQNLMTAPGPLLAGAILVSDGSGRFENFGTTGLIAVLLMVVMLALGWKPDSRVG